jgi:hypothetical protein
VGRLWLLSGIVSFWLFSLSGSATSSFAQPREVPPGLPPISTSLSEGETMIDVDSVGEFAAIIPPAIEHLVKKADMPLPAIGQIPFSDHRELLWQSSGQPGWRPFPFSSVREEGDVDRPIKIARNIEHLWQTPPALEASVSYLRYRASSEPIPLHFRLSRSYGTAESPYSANQLFRELVSFDAPAGLLPLQFLTIRFADGTEDKIWEHSGPVGVRALETWVRHERAGGGLAVPDDLLVHSAAPDAYEYRDVQSAIQLVPFSALPLPSLEESSDGCVILADDPKHPPFNSFSKRFARARGWAPTGIVFVPRRVLILKAVPKSPFPGESEISLYVDRETMMPLIKVVRSESGALQRIVLGAAVIGQTKRGAIIPFMRQVVSITAGGRDVDALFFEEVRRCGVERAVALRAELDTRALSEQSSGDGVKREVREQSSSGQSSKKGAIHGEAKRGTDEPTSGKRGTAPPGDSAGARSKKREE